MSVAIAGTENHGPRKSGLTLPASVVDFQLPIALQGINENRGWHVCTCQPRNILSSHSGGVTMKRSHQILGKAPHIVC